MDLRIVDLTLEVAEGDICPSCHKGKMDYAAPENCSCHIAPPCSSCMDRPLECSLCHFEVQQEKPSYVPCGTLMPFRVIDRHNRNKVFENGAMIYDWKMDSRSGSTMEYEGRYTGELKASDVISYFGDSYFGHLGPSIYGGRFQYTIITD